MTSQDDLSSKFTARIFQVNDAMEAESTQVNSIKVLKLLSLVVF